MDVDLAGARLGREQLDAPAAVDEVEEDELAHVAARHHATGEATRVGPFYPRLELLRLVAHARDLIPVGEPLR